MKKSTKVWRIVLICVVASVIVAVPVVRAYCYWSDEPVFMGNPTMQQLIYHDSDIVMLPEKRENIFSNLAYATYNGNTYVGDQNMGWCFDDDKMQYAGQIHRRFFLHMYQNYDVYVSANVVTEDGTPIFLTGEGGDAPPFYYILEGYEAPDPATSELRWAVCGQSLPDTAKLEDTVDTHAAISYHSDMKRVCTATMTSAEFAFMYDYADVYAYDGQYYLRMGPDTLYPITSEPLLELLGQIEAGERESH